MWMHVAVSSKNSADNMPIEEVIDRIETLNHNLAHFWRTSSGWAPVEAAGLLSKSRLDWQISLSNSLRIWVRQPPDALSAGELILAWVNLGSLMEGTMKLLLSVYYKDYLADIEGLKASRAFDNKKQAPKPPDTLPFDILLSYFKSKDLLDAESQEVATLTQQRRNAVHAFKDRPIGSGTEFQKVVRNYLKMLRDVNLRLPYPEQQYIPQETGKR